VLLWLCVRSDHQTVQRPPDRFNDPQRVDTFDDFIEGCVHVFTSHTHAQQELGAKVRRQNALQSAGTQGVGRDHLEARIPVQSSPHLMEVLQELQGSSDSYFIVLMVALCGPPSLTAEIRYPPFVVPLLREQ